MTPLESSSVGAKVFELKERSLRGISMARTALTGAEGSRGQWYSKDRQVEVLPAQLVLKSVGYKSVRLKGVPFDSTLHVVPHTKGGGTGGCGPGASSSGGGRAP